MWSPGQGWCLKWDIWEEECGGRGAACSGGLSGKQGNARYLGILVKREVSIRILKLDSLPQGLCGEL